MREGFNVGLYEELHKGMYELKCESMYKRVY